jgi:ParB family chromosome partitioning protein
MREFGISQTELGDQVGKSKSAVSNTLRLLELPEPMQKAVSEGLMSEGHGRALLMASDPDARRAIFDKVLAEKLSVRQTEELSRQSENGTLILDDEERPARKPVPKSADLRALENSLQQTLGTKIVIKTRKDPSKGVLNIHFFSFDDFERIVNLLKK